MSMVTVACHKCRRDFQMTHDALRELNDTDAQPHCGCKVRLPRHQRTTTTPLSKADLLLLAIDAAEGGATSPSGLPKSLIVVTAWKRAPAAFCLAGFPEYPDSNRVIMELVKMVSAGLLAQPKKAHYALTEQGRATVERMTTPAAV